MFIDRGVKINVLKVLYVSLVTHEETCKMHLFALGQPPAGSKPAGGSLSWQEWTLHQLLGTVWRSSHTSSDCVSVLLTQLLSNWTSQKHYYPLHSESSCSNNSSCLALWSRMGFFFVPGWCVCRRLWTNDLLCFLPSLFLVFIFVCFFSNIISNATFLACIYNLLYSLKEIYVQEQLWKNVRCSGWVWHPFIVRC